MNTNCTDNSIRSVVGLLSLAGVVWGLLSTACVWAQCDNGVCRPRGSLPGESRPGMESHPAVVRVANALRGSRYYGTGTLVENDEQGGLVLTCAHLFPQGSGDVALTFSDGRRVQARVLALDSVWDLAALETAQSAVKPVTIAVEHPQPGEALRSCGYGSDGRYWCNEGRALGYVRIAASNGYETLELSGSARQGDSGGPVFNQRGELVAVLWGTDGRTVGGTYCGRIRKFLARLLSQRRPQRPQPSPDGAAPPVNAPAPPRGPNDREEGIPERLDELAADLKELHRRLGGQEQSLGQRVQQALEMGASLRGRVERAEAVVGDDNLRAVVREVAGNVLADHGPSLAAKVLPALLAAIGWTGPPSMALILAARVFAVVWKRRRRAVASSTPRKRRSSSRTLGSAEAAGRLLRGLSLSGRNSLADATLGREYDDELRHAAESGDAALSRWARGVRDRVAQKFYRLHSQSAAAGEPLSSARGLG